MVQATLSVILTDVLYVPKFPVSLLSISQFIKYNNSKITYFSSHCVFQYLLTGRRIGSGYEKGGMYYLEDRVTPTGLVVGQPDLVLLWHWRMSHPSVKTLWSVVSIESSVSV